MSTGTQTMAQRARQDPNGEESARRREGRLAIFLNSDTKVVVFSNSDNFSD
ncbi:hypothetical protein TIFTF001_028015 [Ficus carica]|uniref:Uncharacterized protein n=1 Tax=Ficus carica TaxID=3494 RepID=A0AA88DPH4_FICCA|nr:hypothetical protein TIFTF001_028015 [Ficus carica]